MSIDNLNNRIYFGGTIITMNDLQPFVEAIGINNDKIIAVGNLEEVKKKLGQKYELIDLKGNTLLPGFIDSHIHPIEFIFFLFNLDLAKIKSLKELQEILKETSKGKKPNEWIFGLSLKEENFDVPTLPNRWDLDQACPDIPIFILRYDGHIGIANSKALELANLNENSIPPEGGEIRKDEHGNLTGVISETALSLLISHISLPSPKEFIKAALKSFKLLASKGITSVHGIVHLDKSGEFGELGSMEIPLLKSIIDNVLQNWYLMVATSNPKKIKRIKKPPLDEGKEDGKFKVNCVKLFADGTFGAATACMFEPFSDQPDKKGFLILDEEELFNRMKIAHNLGFQICTHVIGDKGNRIVVDLYKRLLKEYPRNNHRHRIEHASMLTPDTLKDIKELGLICSCQPPFINSEYTWLEKRLGKERCKYTYPMKSIVDSNIIFTAGSDCPIEDPDIILGLHALVNRNNFVPEQCLSMKEALKSYTINGAFSAFEENIKGSLEPGKLADLVILDKNPLILNKNQIKEIQVMETIIRGKTVYKKN
jgi:predicted amidohydrolase YtcJ